MKQLFLLILTLIVVSNIFSTDIQNNIKGNTNSLLKSSSTAKTNLKSDKNYNFIDNKKNKKSKKKIKIVKIKRKTFKDPIMVLLNGWLKISTSMFRQSNKFPPIILPNGKEINIKVDKSYFRINEAFQNAAKSSLLPPRKRYFWFRLSGKHLYYSMTKNDINILGDVTVKNILTSYPSQTSNNELNCFKVVDREGRNWKLCAENQELREEWVCTIKDMLGFSDKNCMNPNYKDNNVVVERKVVQPIILIPLPSPKCNDNWDYHLKGSDWDCECSEGKEQSPINLPPVKNAIDSAIKPVFQYDEVLPNEEADTFSIENKSEPLQLKYVDGILKIKNSSIGKLVTLDGSVYFAEEIVFHTPAEHTINGKRFDMEMQIIHYGKTKGDIAKQVVLSFLFEKQPGASNQFIDSLDFYNLPSPTNKVRNLKEPLFVPKIFYTENDKEYPIMKPYSFYTYQGSISNPPCTQRTINFVASQPIKIGTTAFQLFQEAIRMPDLIDNKGNIIQSPVLPENNREIQPLNGRAVFFYDHVKYCGLDAIKKNEKKKGHYEKIIKKKVDYFFVNGVNPSGLPGAFVVTPKEALGNNN